MKISLLGPSGSYTEKAANQFFSNPKNGVSPEFIYQSAIESTVLGLFKDESERADFAVIPIENSIEGAVGISMDLLLEKEVVIAAEIVLPISHCLLISKNAAEDSDFSLDDICCVYSHSQALYQCRSFIRDNLKNARLSETESTSKAALIVSDANDGGGNSGSFDSAGHKSVSAAIASAEAGEKYGLKAVRCGIQDNIANFTRFAVLARSDAPIQNAANAFLSGDFLSKNDDGSTCLKTSLVFSPTHDKPGALFHILEIFYLRQINLTRIESRPSKKALGEYYFYIDLEGTPADKDVAEALSQVSEKASKVKILGTYGKISSTSR